MTKKAFTINFDDFELPCMDTTTLTDEEEDLFSYEILLDMQGALPHTAAGVLCGERDFGGGGLRQLVAELERP